MDRPNLSWLPVFSGLRPEDREHLEERAEEVSFGAGTNLFRSGDMVDRIYILADGWLRLVGPGDKELARIGPGGVVGESEALRGEEAVITVEAASDATVWQLPVEAIRTMVAQSPSALLKLDRALGFRSPVAGAGLVDWLATLDEFRQTSRHDLESIANELESLDLGTGEQLQAHVGSGVAVVDGGFVERRDANPADVTVVDAGQGPIAAALPRREKPELPVVAAGAGRVPSERRDWLSTGSAIRLALILLLLTWVIGYLVYTALQSTGVLAVGAPAQQRMDWQATAVALTPVALAMDAQPTATFAPSPTPAPTNTALPTETPVPATETPVPTKTPVPTPVVAAPQAEPVAVVPTAAPAPEAEVPVEPSPTAMPSDVDFVVASWRQLTACENQGKHNIFINVIDAAGNGIPGVPVHVDWGDGGAEVVTGEKLELGGPGWTVFDMFKGTYWVTVATGTSQTTPPLTVDIPDDSVPESTRRCGDNPVANSRYHYSYEVVFQRTW